MGVVQKNTGGGKEINFTARCAWLGGKKRIDGEKVKPKKKGVM